jgi:hypothetical protein
MVPGFVKAHPYAANGRTKSLNSQRGSPNVGGFLHTLALYAESKQVPADVPGSWYVLRLKGMQRC